MMSTANRCSLHSATGRDPRTPRCHTTPRQPNDANQGPQRRTHFRHRQDQNTESMDLKPVTQERENPHERHRGICDDTTKTTFVKTAANPSDERLKRNGSEETEDEEKNRNAEKIGYTARVDGVREIIEGISRLPLATTSKELEAESETGLPVADHQIKYHRNHGESPPFHDQEENQDQDQTQNGDQNKASDQTQQAEAEGEEQYEKYKRVSAYSISLFEYTHKGFIRASEKLAQTTARRKRLAEQSANQFCDAKGRETSTDGIPVI